MIFIIQGIIIPSHVHYKYHCIDSIKGINIMSDCVEFLEQELSSGCSSEAQDFFLSSNTKEKKYPLIFSISRAKEGRKVGNAVNKQEPFRFQPDVTKKHDSEFSLAIKKLRDMKRFGCRVGAGTEPGTPDEEGSETDSYKFVNQKIAANMGKDKGVFKPNILYSHEVTAKETLQYDRVLIEYLLHATQAISLIKRLQPIPQQFIDMNKVILPINSSIFFYYVNRERNYNI